MKKNYKSFLAQGLALSFLFLSGSHSAALADEGVKINKLNKLLDYVYQKGGFNGNILVAEKGKIIFDKAYGVADLSTGRKLDPDTVFELASVSKQFTAMAITILKEQGKLDFDDPLEKYIPELKYPGVKIIHLLTHTSGLPDYMELIVEHWDKTKIAVNQDAINLLAEYKPAALFPPGEKFAYSNTGYMLLATIVERSSGKSFKDFLKENIFEKLGMKNSTVYHRRKDKEKISNYALGYVYSGEKNRYVLPDEKPDQNYVYYMDGIEGDGIVNSTVNDLYLWDEALYSEKLVKKETLNLIFSPYMLNNRQFTDYGFGWELESFPGYGRITTHSGYWPGYSTMIVRYIDEHKTMIILRNQVTRSKGLGQAIENILHDKEYSLPVIFEKKTPKKESLSSYTDLVGKYRLENEVFIDIFVKDNQLYSQVTDQGPVPIFSSKKDAFFNNEFEFSINFTRDKKQKVSGLVISQAGEKVNCLKVK